MRNEGLGVLGERERVQRKGGGTVNRFQQGGVLCFKGLRFEETLEKRQTSTSAGEPAVKALGVRGVIRGRG